MERSLQDEVKDLESQLEILSLNKFNSASDKGSKLIYPLSLFEQGFVR